MKIEMEFQGLKELMKAFEDAASDEDIRAVNKKIVEQGEPVVKRIMSGKIPKSADIKLSGRGFGSKSSVTSHAADSVPLGAVKVKDTGASADVGWEKSDNSRCDNIPCMWQSDRLCISLFLHPSCFSPAFNSRTDSPPCCLVTR